jgi:hypothetical protein
MGRTARGMPLFVHAQPKGHLDISTVPWTLDNTLKHWNAGIVRLPSAPESPNCTITLSLDEKVSTEGKEDAAWNS